MKERLMQNSMAQENSSDEKFDNSMDRALHGFLVEDSRVGLSLLPEDYRAEIVDDAERALVLRVHAMEGSSALWQDHRIDCIRQLAMRPSLERALSAWGSKAERAESRRSQVSSLRRGFFRFLANEVRPDGVRYSALMLQDMQPGDLVRFAKFLRHLNVQNASRRSYATAARTFLRECLVAPGLDDRTKAAVQKIVSSLPYRFLCRDAAAPSQDVISEGRRAEAFLSIEAILQINDAVEADVRRIVREWDERQRLLAKARAEVGVAPVSHEFAAEENILAAIAFIDARCTGLLPKQSEDNSGILRRAFRFWSKATLEKFFYGSIDEAIPLYLLLLIRLRYNPTTLAEMTWNDVTDRGDHVVFAPFKGRAGSYQVRSEPAGDSCDPLSARSLLRVIGEMTRRIRTAAPLD
jgi:hypothetical protein